MTKMILVIASLVMVTGVSFAKGEKSRKPASINGNVMVGGDENMDACGGWGIVLATTTLMRFTSGQMTFGKVDVNTEVFSCDGSSDGEYVGIVFGKKGQDCKVSAPIKDKQEYKGPCKSGWIKKSFFELLAG